MGIGNINLTTLCRPNTNFRQEVIKQGHCNVDWKRSCKWLKFEGKQQQTSITGGV